jgi:hypothetical protein
MCVHSCNTQCQNLGAVVNGSWRGRASTANERVDADASCVCFALKMRPHRSTSTGAILLISQIPSSDDLDQANHDQMSCESTKRYLLKQPRYRRWSLGT